MKDAQGNTVLPVFPRPTGATVLRNAYKLSAPDFAEFERFVATLPADVQSVCEGNLYHIWKQAKENARIASNIENRADELADTYHAIVRELEAKGFTLADLEAVRRHLQGSLIFGSGKPDYVLPLAYRKSTYQSEHERKEMEVSGVNRAKRKDKAKA